MGYSGLDVNDSWPVDEDDFEYGNYGYEDEVIMAQKNSANCECDEDEQCDLCNGKYQYKFVPFSPGRKISITIEQEKDRGLSLSHVSDNGMYFRDSIYDIPLFENMQQVYDYADSLR